MTMFHRYRFAVSTLVPVLVVLLATTLVGCAQPAAPTPTPTPPPKAAPSPAPKPSPTPEAKPAAKETKPEKAAQPDKPAPKAEAKAVKIRLAYSALTGGQLPPWVAKEKGLFEKYGLDVELVYIAQTPVVARSMVAGELHIGQSAGGLINATLGGADLIFVANTLPTLLNSLWSQPDITRMEQLKGKTVAAGRLGSLGDFAARFALEKFGLEPDKDVTLVEAGGPPERLAALMSGGVQASVIGPPSSLRAKEAGMYELASFFELGVPVIDTGVAVSKAYLAKSPETVRNFMKAYLEAIAVAKKDKPFTVQVIGKYTQTDNKAILDETYETTVPKAIPRVPYVTAEAIQAHLKMAAVEIPAAKDAKPETFFDNSLVKELDDSGFIRKLYE
ncbi:MAG: ABC transporter substrate-binding protein [Chloroflexi bacterium]|nr:ABC transporter substrate-binding protein [Chloroflexota bacterium]